MTILTEAQEVLDPLCHTSPDEFRRLLKLAIERIQTLERQVESSLEASYRYADIYLSWCEYTGGHIPKEAFHAAVMEAISGNIPDDLQVRSFNIMMNYSQALEALITGRSNEEGLSEQPSDRSGRQSHKP